MTINMALELRKSTHNLSYDLKPGLVAGAATVDKSQMKKDRDGERERRWGGDFFVQKPWGMRAARLVAWLMLRESCSSTPWCLLTSPSNVSVNPERLRLHLVSSEILDPTPPMVLFIRCVKYKWHNSREGKIMGVVDMKILSFSHLDDVLSSVKH